jgi:hypothetical protein
MGQKETKETLTEVMEENVLKRTKIRQKKDDRKNTFKTTQTHKGIMKIKGERQEGKKAHNTESYTRNRLLINKSNCMQANKLFYHSQT